MDVSVIVPTRDRGPGLSRCLSALAAQQSARPHEVIVVDDSNAGSAPAAPLAPLPDSARLVRTGGRGPAVARNRGIADARGDVILFTDDDVLPSSGWIDAACGFLDRHPEAVGVEGPTLSLAYDELYAYSVENHRPGAYWTCNVAYRRWVLEAIGGFCEEFPWPHCEDLDLGFRALRLGPIGFVDEMRVVHVPRQVTIGELVRRSRFAASELVLFSRHPDQYESRLPHRVLPVAGWLRHHWRLLRRERWRLVREPRRLIRFAAIAIGMLGGTFATLVQSPRTRGGGL